jgi:hypothetical protein
MVDLRSILAAHPALSGLTDQQIDIIDAIANADPGPDQHERFPGRLHLYRVGTYVEFDVWARDGGDAWAIVTNLGIPEGQTRHLHNLPGLTMAGAINGNRVTAAADIMRVLNMHSKADTDA